MFKNLFKPKLKEEIQDTNSICFSIDKKGEISLKIDLRNTDELSAEKLATVLFYINEGYYVQSILDNLTELSIKNNTYLKFIQKTISLWSNKIIENDNIINNYQDKPIISPGEFNSTSKNNNSL